MFRVLIDLDFRHTVAREEFREGKIRTEQQQKFGLIYSAVSAAVTDQAGHAHCIGIVVFQPLLAAERVPNRRL